MKKMFHVLMIYLALCVCFAHVALAASAIETSSMTVFNDVVHLLAYSLGVTIMGLVALGVKKLHEKWSIQVPAAWMSKTQQTLGMGIAYAEEQARKAFEKTKISSNDKLQIAAAFVLAGAGDDKKLVRLGEERIKQLIEARLNLTREIEHTEEPKVEDLKDVAP